MDFAFKLTEFNIYNGSLKCDQDYDSDSEDNLKSPQHFIIQMFGLDEEGRKASIFIEDYNPFFYLKVANNWRETTAKALLEHLKSKVGLYHSTSILECSLIDRKKLYGFDAGKKHRFVEIKFANTIVYNKVKNLWYKDGLDEDGEKERQLLKEGYKFVHNGERTFIELYEANIPPLLRFFHIREISPSGWISLPKDKYTLLFAKTTSCDYEFIINYKDIVPLNDKERSVPYNIMSTDGEMSSSHGDFPVPVKSYKKLATNIVDHFEKIEDIDRIKCKLTLRSCVSAAFGFEKMDGIDLVYPKEPLKDIEDLQNRTESWLKTKIRDRKKDDSDEHIVEALFEAMHKSIQPTKEDTEEKEKDKEDSDSDDESIDDTTSEYEGDNTSLYVKSRFNKTYSDMDSTIADIMCDKKFEREGKINELIRTLRNNFPPLEGDKITFIGSTFMKYGQTEPYLNHCIVLNSCNRIPVENSQIETYETEKEVLLAWTRLVQRMDPDIITGYNISMFDYEFMFRRSQELGCTEEFLQLSRNIGEICATIDYKNPGKLDIDRSSTKLASGSYELANIKMNGRVQIDMLNWFRRTENLTSYKLDYVGSHFIGDEVKSLKHECRDGVEITRIMTTNMTGLQKENFIHFEEINHSSDYYKDGAKFKVMDVCKLEGWFEILGTENPSAKKVKWGLAKDDVTPKDIFRMTNEGPESRAIIAKYCIQDCNLVHYLFNKVDVITDLVEMAKLCSVPMSFLISRGQGIKLTSYVAKKCREKGVLMPVINRGTKNDGYEGAIVLPPKCGLYLEDPVCVGDFASLYPSSMLSENLCPSSKVWTKIYDLAGNLILETGDKDANGIYIYDNLPGIEYVDVKFDTYSWIKKNPKARAEKIRTGYKECRFAQPTYTADGIEEKAIMPSILQELLKARKDTRKLIPKTLDEFMKNVLDKRQLAYKVTANSLYGQLGAKTSTFYEPDIAASTTATGRLLLTFAKKVVEECYGDATVETKCGFVNTKAEYVYGDSVANYTPIYIKTHDIIDVITIDTLAEKYGNNNWIKYRETGTQDKECCELNDVETWTEKGWTKLYRIIRHELASHKKMIRVLTHTGCVDVTDDHSLVKTDGSEISPKDCKDGIELLHHKLSEKITNNDYTEMDEMLIGNFCIDDILEASKYINYLNINQIPFRLNSDDNLSIIVVPNPCEIRQPTSIIKLYEINYNGYVYDLTTDNHHFAAGVGNMIVHNTDSVFFKFNLTDKETGEKIVGDKALELSIEIAQEACHHVSKVLKQPHDFEYEKTFMPFCLLSKKRYVSIKYEFDPTKGKRNEMGIVLKRRDNAPIVKDIYGGVIDILMKEKNITKAIDYVHKCLQDLVDGNVPIDKLIITKSLRSFYKNPQGVAHKVLADRIGQRETGNKPTSGDRIPFVYIVTKPPPKGKKILQGDKIETPTFIKENKLQIDYSFYITNQIMKPLLQLFGLVLKDIWLSQKPPRRAKVTKLQESIDKIKSEITDEKKCDKKISKIKDKEVEELIFAKYLRDTNNAKNGNQSLTNFFSVKK
jgi:DNA polymerase elongation subunit (family B)